MIIMPVVYALRKANLGNRNSDKTDKNTTNQISNLAHLPFDAVHSRKESKASHSYGSRRATL
jgi:hypothetical protein